jgi:hypothetical protein
VLWGPVIGADSRRMEPARNRSPTSLVRANFIRRQECAHMAVRAPIMNPSGRCHLEMRMPGRLNAELQTFGVPPSGGSDGGNSFRPKYR